VSKISTNGQGAAAGSPRRPVLTAVHTNCNTALLE